MNPVLNQRIDWLWFVVSQMGFGIVAGIVVSRQERIRTWQRLPFAVRAGMEAPACATKIRKEDRQMSRRWTLILASLLITSAAVRGRARPDSQPRIQNRSRPAGFWTSHCFTGELRRMPRRERKGRRSHRLADPVYLAIADDATIRRVTADGVPEPPCPPLRTSGGMLTDAQIDVIVHGIRSRWAKPDALRGAEPPPYAASGNPAMRSAERRSIATYCSSCHGRDGTAERAPAPLWMALISRW